MCAARFWNHQNDKKFGSVLVKLQALYTEWDYTNRWHKNLSQYLGCLHAIFRILRHLKSYIVCFSGNICYLMFFHTFIIAMIWLTNFVSPLPRTQLLFNSLGSCLAACTLYKSLLYTNYILHLIIVLKFCFCGTGNNNILKVDIVFIKYLQLIHTKIEEKHNESMNLAIGLDP